MPKLPIKIYKTRVTFNTRYKEYREGSSNSTYSNCIINTGDIYGTKTDIIDVQKFS